MMNGALYLKLGDSGYRLTTLAREFRHETGGQNSTRSIPMSSCVDFWSSQRFSEIERGGTRWQQADSCFCRDMDAYSRRSCRREGLLRWIYWNLGGRVDPVLV